MDGVLKYIVFLIDSRINQHDGKIFSSREEARQYGIDSLVDNYCTSIIIGSFICNQDAREMNIHAVEKFSSKQKNTIQLDLFK